MLILIHWWLILRLLWRDNNTYPLIGQGRSCVLPERGPSCAAGSRRVRLHWLGPRLRWACVSLVAIHPGPGLDSVGVYRISRGLGERLAFRLSRVGVGALYSGQMLEWRWSQSGDNWHGMGSGDRTRAWSKLSSRNSWLLCWRNSVSYWTPFSFWAKPFLIKMSMERQS